MKLRCNSCGGVLSDKMTFCPNCGRQILPFDNDEETVVIDKSRSNDAYNQPTVFQQPVYVKNKYADHPKRSKTKIVWWLLSFLLAILVVTIVFLLIKSNQFKSELAYADKRISDASLKVEEAQNETRGLLDRLNEDKAKTRADSIRRVREKHRTDSINRVKARAKAREDSINRVRAEERAVNQVRQSQKSVRQTSNYIEYTTEGDWVDQKGKKGSKMRLCFTLDNGYIRNARYWNLSDKRQADLYPVYMEPSYKNPYFIFNGIDLSDSPFEIHIERINNSTFKGFLDTYYSMDDTYGYKIMKNRYYITLHQK